MARCYLSTQWLSEAQSATRRPSAAVPREGQNEVGLRSQLACPQACQNIGHSPSHKEPGQKKGKG